MQIYNATGERPDWVEVSLFNYNGTDWIRFDTAYWSILVPSEIATQNVLSWIYFFLFDMLLLNNYSCFYLKAL